MSDKVFAAIQPKHGDRVLTCSHVVAGDAPGCFYGLSVSFETGEPEGTECTRPDGSKIKPKWIVICDACEKEHKRNPMGAVTGDAEWLGDEPVIKVVAQ